jgi:hypothetical protein
MQFELGEPYEKDDDFKKQARLHQSKFRRDVLSVDYDEYGNRLKYEDAKNLLNYYKELGVRKVLRKRYPDYSKSRDADMLRSEHIPFNFFAPLKYKLKLAKDIFSQAFGLDIKTITRVKLEYAPKPKDQYLNDSTSFDTYIQYISPTNELSGIGIEVKYTEHSYKIGDTEKANVENPDSRYWTLTKKSGIFIESQFDKLVEDDMRQIWRNHLLGISMIENKDIKKFTSVIVYPSGNAHFNKVIPEYQSILTDNNKNTLIGCAFEKYIDSIQDDDPKIIKWKNYLDIRYIVREK